jgi:hypothetical protein
MTHQMPAAAGLRLRLVSRPSVGSNSLCTDRQPKRPVSLIQAAVWIYLEHRNRFCAGLMYVQVYAVTALSQVDRTAKSASVAGSSVEQRNAAVRL